MNNNDEVQKGIYLAEEIMLAAGDFNPVKCENTIDRSQRITITVSIFNSTSNPEPYDSVNIDKCQERCIITAARRELCSNMDTIIEYNIQVTFWGYLAIRVFLGMIRKKKKKVK